MSTLAGIPGYGTISYGNDNFARQTTLTNGGVQAVKGVTYSGSAKPLTVTSQVNGGGSTTDTYTYDPYTDRMTSYMFNIAGVTDKGTLTWNADGDLGQLQIVDDLSGTSDSQTCSFGYDDVNRLVTDNCGSSHWNQTFTYDQYNNLKKTGNPGGNLERLVRPKC